VQGFRGNLFYNLKTEDNKPHKKFRCQIKIKFADKHKTATLVMHLEDDEVIVLSVILAITYNLEKEKEEGSKICINTI
jgi:hypothetical protein